ncbi:hypothetical protein JCM5296_000705 [Sporobolomyces johnsonii]
MTIPPLPLELVRLIADQASDDFEECERHESGSAMALVQRSWRLAGQSLAWHTVTLNLACDDPLLKHLVHHEQLLPLVKRLAIEMKDGDQAEEEPDDHYLWRYKALTKSEVDLIPRLLQRCTRLETVHLADDSINTQLLLSLLAHLPSAAKLDHLTAMVRKNTGLDGEQLVNSLAAFTSLRTLRLHIVEWIAVPYSRAPSPVPAPRLLNLVELEFILVVGSLSGPGIRPALIDAVFSLVNLSTLRHLTFNPVFRDDGPSLLAWLPNATSLSTLAFGCTDPEDLAIVVPTLVKIFPHLSSLRDLEIYQHRADIEIEEAEVPSPVGLLDFLDSLPPSLCHAAVTSVYFPAERFLDPPPFDCFKDVARRYGHVNCFIMPTGASDPTRRVAGGSIDATGTKAWFDITDHILRVFDLWHSSDDFEQT